MWMILDKKKRRTRKLLDLEEGFGNWLRDAGAWRNDHAGTESN